MSGNLSLESKAASKSRSKTVYVIYGVMVLLAIKGLSAIAKGLATIASVVIR